MGVMWSSHIRLGRRDTEAPMAVKLSGILHLVRLIRQERWAKPNVTVQIKLPMKLNLSGIPNSEVESKPYMRDSKLA